MNVNLVELAASMLMTSRWLTWHNHCPATVATAAG